MSSSPPHRSLVPRPDAPGTWIAAITAVVFSCFAVALGTIVVVATQVAP